MENQPCQRLFYPCQSLVPFSPQKPLRQMNQMKTDTPTYPPMATMPRRVSVEQRYQLRLRLARHNLQPGQGDRQLEPPRTGAAGVDIQHTLPPLDARLVRVAADDS